ncbi:MAG: hypothetical protein US72_C0002G0013 [Microgenomates group bacterium GW2011_GWC1_38_12]|uniref:Uncharacterized protein n=2 Tax=Candidatus Vogeliibacteriota TaxID=1817922 RepID=A0A1G2QEZ1_9BACT|nr:MAG: hypothetical protein US72_C0002G0013 [Microgenomates group bacterium GW2011_GWC1_38_12]KKS78119.1 MAG: hypothetical protein UV50_C0001G0029 [Parcubacteria group bacterium GW2011_GWB1_42_9]OHA59154.1 MAG: hypothetical protein A2370_03135 [Candidatus Vogelbacteria bacterium RIFOXYB1_FULL_42_16]OHA59855.1 MAG: hypothetical protein A2607_01170 [Candidatus Vogelbacteria bacterium RIFOXYD1_FULL_42_15]
MFFKNIVDLIKKNKYLFLAVIFVLFFSILPHLYSVYLAGSSWQGILPEYTNDGLYYYARMSDVGQGNFFLGNPYFLEHRGEYAPAFFVADWLASWPLLLGLSLSWTVFINYLIWPLFLFFALLFLFEELGLSRLISIGGSLVGYLSVHELMSRPVIMQVIFPFFILFLMVLLRYFKNPKQKKLIVPFVLVYAFSFYLYSYLWQISVLSIFFLLIWLVLEKKWSDFRSLVLINFLTFIFVWPVIIYTYWQITSPYFLETMSRLGLVKTHLPTSLAILDCLLVVVSELLLFLTLYWCRSDDKNSAKTIVPFFIVSGLALTGADLSNLITGQEMEIANHIGRFITIWLVIILVYLGIFLKNNYTDLFKLPKVKKIFIFSLLGVIIIMLISPIKNFLPSLINRVTDQNRAEIKELQNIAGPLVWLKENTKSNSVVWINKKTSHYVPIYAHRHVLFSSGGGLHLMPSAELEERYLVANYFRNLTLADIKKDFRSYAGVGNAIHQYQSHNRQVKLCRFLKLERLNYSCGQMMDSLTWRGEKYFFDLYQKYLNDIKPNIDEKLAKYHVNYILVDHREDQLKLPVSNIANAKLVYKDQRFEIYQIGC